MPPAITPFALENARLLRLLAEGRFTAKSALAAELGRDKSNLHKTLTKLTDEGFVENLALTPAGANAVRLLDAMEAQGGRSADDARGHGEELPTGYRAIPLHHIFQDDLNPRKDFDSDEAKAAIGELADSIARDGLLENLVVRRDPKGMDVISAGEGGREIRDPAWRIVAGERRWRAMNELVQSGRWTYPVQVTCRVVELDEASARRVALVENLQRRDLKPLEEARALKELMAVTGVGTAEIATEIGFTQRWAQQRLQLLELSEPLQGRLQAGQISIEDGRRIVAMWDRLPPIKQAELEKGVSSVDSVKTWLDAQPEPLSPRAQLALAELLSVAAKGFADSYHLAAEVRGRIERIDNGPNSVSVRVRIDDPALAELRKRRIVEEPSRIFVEGVETGRCKLAFTYWGEQTAKEALPEATDARKRPGLIARLRIEVLGEGAAAELPEGAFATAWLNGPFETTPEVQAEIDAKREERLQREQNQKAQREKDQAERAAKTAEAKARLEAAGGQVETTLRAAAQVPGATAAAILGAARDLGLALPLYMSERGQILDANAVEIVDWSYYEDDHLAHRRFLVAVVNALAGLETPTEEPVALDPDAMDQADFVQVLAGHLMEGDDDITRDQAAAWAQAGLARHLADEAIVYAEADYDWSDDGALDLAGWIRSDVERPGAQAAA